MNLIIIDDAFMRLRMLIKINIFARIILKKC